MVDRVYKAAVPEFRLKLSRLRREFATLPSKTDWIGLRINPLLRHVASLEKVLGNKRHATQISRLTRGVSMFHSDLVYLQHNIQELGKTLERERRALTRRM